MSIVCPYCVNFNVKAIGRQEFLIDIRALLSDLSSLNRGEELGAVVVCLSEEDVVACTTRAVRAVVNNDLMIFSIHRLFYIRFVESLAIYDKVILILLNSNFLIFIEQFVLLMMVEAILIITRESWKLRWVFEFSAAYFFLLNLFLEV